MQRDAIMDDDVMKMIDKFNVFYDSTPYLLAMDERRSPCRGMCRKRLLVEPERWSNWMEKTINVCEAFYQRARISYIYVHAYTLIYTYTYNTYYIGMFCRVHVRNVRGRRLQCGPRPFGSHAQRSSREYEVPSARATIVRFVSFVYYC